MDKAFSAQNSTKDLILATLGEEWPLTAKQIHARVSRNAGKSVSYQAVHKTVAQMLSEGVLAKNGKNYSISESYIKKLKQSAHALESKYSGQPEQDFSAMLKKDATVFHFHGILELARFLIGGLMQVPNPENKPTIFLTAPVYSIVGIKDEDYKELTEHFRKTPTYCFCAEKNFLDKMFADALKKLGINEVHFVGNPASALQDVFVAGDFVCHVWFEPTFRQAWFEQNRIPKDLESFDLGEHLAKMRDYPAPITAIVAKDPALADQIREAYLGKQAKFFRKV